MRLKVVNYLRNNMMVWVVYPETKQIEVYAPDGEIRKLGIDDTLEGGSILPGFKVAVKDIFKTP